MVLNTAELRPGAEANKLSGVAEGIDAYYTGAGDSPGREVGGDQPVSNWIVRWTACRCGRDPPNRSCPPGARV